MKLKYRLYPFPGSKKYAGLVGFGIAFGLSLLISPPLAAWGAEQTRTGDLAPQETIYGIGSTSKVVVTAAVMKLADEGLVDLDAPLTTYIPEFEMDDIRYQAITPRMLLDHTSGIPGSTLSNTMLLGDNDTYNHDHLLENLKSQRLKADPGEYGTYCNDGFTLAEILVERVTGISFTDYLEETFSKPLGLEHFKTPQSKTALDSEKAPVYDSQTGYELPPESANVIGSGGIYASAEDLCRFSSIFIKSEAGNFLSKEAQTQMERSTYGEQLGISGTDSTLEYGLGWDSVNTYPFNRYGIKALTKGGDTTYYHGSLTVLPEEGISCAVLSSGGSSNYNDIAVKEILLTYLDEIEQIDREESRENQETVSTTEKPAGTSASEKPAGASASETPADASSLEHTTITMPPELTSCSGTYIGNQFFQVDITSNGTLTLSGSESDYAKPQTYQYGTDGKFHSSMGSYINMGGQLSRSGGGKIGRSTLEFKTAADGRQYMMTGIHETYPGLGDTANYLPIAAKLTDAQMSRSIDDAVMAEWQKRDGKEYYLVSDKYSSTTYLNRFVIEPQLPAQPEGYLVFKDGMVTPARLTDPLNAEFFQQIPGQAGRDLNDYRIEERDGTEYFLSGSFLYRSSDNLPSLPASDEIITIGESGEALWFTVDDAQKNRTLVIEKPEHGSYFIYDHGRKEMSCTASSYSGAPGQQLIVPKDGRIAFVGDAGAEFRINYVN